MIKEDKTDEIDRDEEIENRDVNDDENERARERDMKIWESSFLRRLVRAVNFDIFGTHATIRWANWSSLRSFWEMIVADDPRVWKWERAMK